MDSQAWLEDEVEGGRHHAQQRVLHPEREPGAHGGVDLSLDGVPRGVLSGRLDTNAINLALTH